MNLSLKAEGVDTLFGIAGDHILDMLDRMIDEPFRMIDTRHESGAVHAADSYSRILRRASVALSTTPGHANAVPALANALHSEAPVVNIAGSADSPNLGRGAMQEIDQVGIARAVTKGAWEVPSPERIPEYVALAFRTALSGRQGPVHLTIPHDYQSAEVDSSDFERYAPREYSVPNKVLAGPRAYQSSDPDIELSRTSLDHGPVHPQVRPQTRKKFGGLVETTRIPFVSEDSARSLIPDSHAYSIGLGYLPLKPRRTVSQGSGCGANAWQAVRLHTRFRRYASVREWRQDDRR